MFAACSGLRGRLMDLHSQILAVERVTEETQSAAYAIFGVAFEDTETGKIIIATLGNSDQLSGVAGRLDGEANRVGGLISKLDEYMTRLAS
jgi:hypothetical protein